MKITLKDEKLKKLILIGPFRASGEYVFSRYGAEVSFTMDEGTSEQKANFLNDWWASNAVHPA